MKIQQIGDWTLEDRLATDFRPVVVMFHHADRTADRRRRIELRRLAGRYPEASFFEIDLIENPSVKEKYGLPEEAAILVFVDAVEIARHCGPHTGPMLARLFGSFRPDGEEP